MLRAGGPWAAVGMVRTVLAPLPQDTSSPWPWDLRPVTSFLYHLALNGGHRSGCAFQDLGSNTLSHLGELLV